MEQNAAQKAALVELTKTIEQVKTQQDQLVAGVEKMESENAGKVRSGICLLYTSPSPRDRG